MEGPWFRRFMGIGYLPINRKGWIAVCVTVAVAVPCGYFFVATGGVVKWLFGIIGFITAVICNGLALRHMEER